MEIAERVALIKSRIAEAAARSGRTAESISLVAVSKKQPLAKINDFLDLFSGERQEVLLGESYVQEYRQRKDLLQQNYKVHFIGKLQANKVREAVSLFDVIESVNSPEQYLLIDKEAKRIGKIQQVFLQVNISDDTAKSGFDQRRILSFLKRDLNVYANVLLRGLMTITRLHSKKEDLREDFRKMETLHGLARQELLGRYLFPEDPFELSMGMSDDFEMAIEEGATIVRLGSALFGSRQ